MQSGCLIPDDDLWRLAVTAVTVEFQSLTSSRLSEVRTAVEALVALKLAMHAVAEMVDCAEICSGCGGECCSRGKYHFSVIDLIVFLSTGRELFEPDFANGMCPYLGGNGCLMPAAFRPFTCITFNCERIESSLQPLDREFFYAAEKKLRLSYKQLQEIFADSRMRGALMSYVTT